MMAPIPWRRIPPRCRCESLPRPSVELATYITNNRDHVVNYGERIRAGERMSTGFVESAINQTVDKRCDKVSRCAGHLAPLTCRFRPEPALSTATSINSFVAAIPRSGDHSTLAPAL